MKKILSLLIGLGFIGNIFAVQINMNTDKNIVNLNDTFKLDLKIISDKPGQIVIKKIKGLKNFEIIGQNESSSSSAQIVVINGTMKQKIINNYNLSYYLKPIYTGNITIGPAIVKIGDKIYKSNSINIQVLSNFIGNNFSGNSNITQQKNIQNLQNNTNSPNITPISSNNQLTSSSIPPIKPKNSFNIILLVLGISFIIGTFVLMYALSKKNKTNEISDIENKISVNQSNQTLSINKNIQTNSTNLSFLEKYGIKNYQNKTYSEIMQEIKNLGINLTDEEQKMLENELILKYKNS